MRITITNDGATILKSVPVDNPAAKVLVEIAKTQDDTVGDGTTSVAVLCGELLREAEFLVNQRVHPMTIMAGWRQVKQKLFLIYLYILYIHIIYIYVYFFSHSFHSSSISINLFRIMIQLLTTRQNK